MIQKIHFGTHEQLITLYNEFASDLNGNVNIFVFGTIYYLPHMKCYETVQAKNMFMIQ